PAESVRSGGARSRPLVTASATGTPAMGAPVESRASKISGTAARRPTIPRWEVPATQPVPVGEGRTARDGRVVVTGTGAARAAGTVMNSTVVWPLSVVPSAATTVSDVDNGAGPARRRNDARPRASVTAIASAPPPPGVAAPTLPLPPTTNRPAGTARAPPPRATA